MTNYRSYLLSSTIFFGLWSLSMLYASFVDPSLAWYDFPAYGFVEAVLPFEWWGAITAALAGAFSYEFLISKENKKAWGTTILASVATFVTGIWAIGLAITLAQGLNSPLGFLLFNFCAAAHVRAVAYSPTELDPQAVHEAVETMRRLSADNFH